MAPLFMDFFFFNIKTVSFTSARTHTHTHTRKTLIPFIRSRQTIAPTSLCSLLKNTSGQNEDAAVLTGLKLLLVFFSFFFYFLFFRKQLFLKTQEKKKRKKEMKHSGWLSCGMAVSQRHEVKHSPSLLFPPPKIQKNQKESKDAASFKETIKTSRYISKAVEMVRLCVRVRRHVFAWKTFFFFSHLWDGHWWFSIADYYFFFFFSSFGRVPFIDFASVTAGRSS